jgi:hypothetical protein
MSIEVKAGVIAGAVAMFAVLFWWLLIENRLPSTDPVLVAAAIGSSALTTVSVLVGMVFALDAAKKRP